MNIIGVDIGGTKISAGLIDNRQLVHKNEHPTPYDQEKEVVLETLQQSIDELFSNKVEGIGIGVPGLVDLETNEVLDVLNIPSWDRIPLKKILEARYHVPVFVNNDANCFALGEKHFGKGQQWSNFVGISIGTGLGTGIIINNHLYSGRFCGAGEFGLLYYRDKVLEAYASGQYFKDQELSGLTLARQAEDGDEVALRLFNELGANIGRALINIMFALAPEAVVIGGSVSRSFHLFEKEMHRVLESEFPYQRLSRALKIEISELKDSALYGASSLVLDQIA